MPYVRKVLEKDPKDLGANVTLGQVYLQMRQFEEAAAAFRIALAAEPYNVSAAYNLGVALTRAGKREEGQAAMAAFQKLRDSAYKSALGSNYLEQGKYAEALASTGAEPEAVDAKTPAVSLAEKDEALAGASTLVLADLDGDGTLDAVTAGRGGLRAAAGRGGTARRRRRRRPASPGSRRPRRWRGTTTTTGCRTSWPRLRAASRSSTTRAAGASRPRPRRSPPGRTPRPPPPSSTSTTTATSTSSRRRARRAGPPSSSGTTATAPSPTSRRAAQLGGAGGAVAVVPTDFDNRRDIDLFVLKHDRPALFKNMRDGTFKDLAAELGLVATGPFTSAAAGDVNKDGYTDFFLGAKGASSLALSDGRGAFTVAPAPPAAAGALAAQLVDYDNDGLLDLLVVTREGPAPPARAGGVLGRRERHGLHGAGAQGDDRGRRPGRGRPRRRRRRGRAAGDALRPSGAW